MVVSTRCKGRSLLNHLKNLNVEVVIEHEFCKRTLLWSGKATVYGTTFGTTKKKCKGDVIEQLMLDAEALIYANLNLH